MKTSFLTPMLFLILAGFAGAQSIPPDSLYFGQTPPGNIPVVFAPGIVSLPGRNEAVITFSPDGASVFFYIQKYPQPGNPFTMYSTYTNNQWITPDTIPFSVGRSTGEPSFAHGGTRLYMFATNAVNHAGIADLSYSELQGTNWSDPISMGNPPNSEAYQYHPCIVGDSSVYFSSSAGPICRCQYENGVYLPRMVLPVPVNFIGQQTWGDPYVSSSESYMILKSIRMEGYGQNDLYIAYKKTDGTWTNPKNLGNVINTPGDETSGDITPDGLYMTYGRDNDLYWVSSGFVDSLQYTNFLPYVKNPVPDQTATTGVLFIYTVPDTTFVDDDGNNTLSFTATLSNGNPLPAWLAFDTLSATFSGTPPVKETLTIRLTATDTAGASVSTTFKLFVDYPVPVNQITGEAGDVTIFPNPTIGLIHLSSDVFSGKKKMVEISNLSGRTIVQTSFSDHISINLANEVRGMYILKLFTGNEIIVRKVVLNN